MTAATVGAIGLLICAVGLVCRQRDVAYLGLLVAAGGVLLAVWPAHRNL